MKAASSAEIKQELRSLDQQQLLELCLRLARFKQENKELLTFLLFESDDLESYALHVKEEIDEQFRQVNTSSIYFAKKTIRKILRITNKFLRYAGSRQVEAEVLLHFIRKLKALPLTFKEGSVLDKIYVAQLKKLSAAIAALHEDLQYDYVREMNKIKDQK